KLQRTRQALASHAMAPAAASPPDAPHAEADAQLRDAAKRLTAASTASMDDDLHTPGALAALFDFQREANRLLDAPAGRAPGAGAALAALAAYEAAAHALTLFDRPLARATAVPEALKKAAAGLAIDLGEAHTDAHAMVRFVDARAAARAAKDWKRGDAIRDAAKAAGYLIEDTPTGQRWRRL
ncbi:MAG: cysteinyl-tRNA synthetase, partial [Thermoplasmata archaeon]|nr:cysteinyl-tRNA synthetase [Thermoplasmata archaeon]